MIRPSIKSILFVIMILVSTGLLLAHSPALAADLYGVVFSPQGSPVAGVIVEIAKKGGPPIKAQRTNIQGAFHFQGLPPGPYELRCKGRKWDTYVEPGHTYFDLRL